MMTDKSDHENKDDEKDEPGGENVNTNASNSEENTSKNTKTKDNHSNTVEPETKTETDQKQLPIEDTSDDDDSDDDDSNIEIKQPRKINFLFLILPLLICIISILVYILLPPIFEKKLVCKNETVRFFQNEKYIILNQDVFSKEVECKFKCIKNISDYRALEKLINLYKFDSYKKKCVNKKRIPSGYETRFGKMYIEILMKYDIFLNKLPINWFVYNKCIKRVEIHNYTVMGIDLGTTYSTIGKLDTGKETQIKLNNGEIDVIIHDNSNKQKGEIRKTQTLFNFKTGTQLIQNKKSIPSAVYFEKMKDGDNNQIYIHVGYDAVDRIRKDPINGAFDIKRIIGRKKGERELLNWQKLHKHNILIYDKNNNPLIKIPNLDKPIRLETISAIILLYLVNTASEQYNVLYNKPCVISIPAYFHNGQRMATRTAINLANLNLIKLINEPTSGALSALYNGQLSPEQSRFFLAFDWGGGTLDVSVIKCRGGKLDCHVTAVEGNSTLGGNDFDKIILKILENKYPNYVDALNRYVGESIKIELSKNYPNAVKYMLGNGMEVEITRKEFEEHPDTVELINNAIKLADIAFNEGNKDVAQDGHDIQQESLMGVLLIGGTCQIPLVKQMIEQKYSHLKENIIMSSDSQLLVAKGATIVGGSESHDIDLRSNNKVFINDVIPLNIGVKGRKGELITWVKKFQEYPLNFTKQTCQLAGLNELKLNIYEGDNANMDNLHLLLSEHIEYLPNREFDYNKDEYKCNTLNINFKIDENGVANIDIVTIEGKQMHLTFYGNKLTIDDNEMNNIKNEMGKWWIRNNKNKFIQIKDVWNNSYFKYPEKL